MTKIKTAEEILIDRGILTNGCTKFIVTMSDGKEHVINDIMIEYAKQFIDAANESAEVEWGYAPDECYVNQESILKLKELVK